MEDHASLPSLVADRWHIATCARCHIGGSGGSGTSADLATVFPQSFALTRRSGELDLRAVMNGRNAVGREGSLQGLCDNIHPRVDNRAIVINQRAAMP
jgi:hypothetical protein